MTQLELAIRYLKRRAVSSEKVNNKLIKAFGAVLSVREVEFVLLMVKKKKFKKQYKKWKKMGLRECI